MQQTGGQDGPLAVPQAATFHNSGYSQSNFQSQELIFMMSLSFWEQKGRFSEGEGKCFFSVHDQQRREVFYSDIGKSGWMERVKFSPRHLGDSIHVPYLVEKYFSLFLLVKCKQMCTSLGRTEDLVVRRHFSSLLKCPINIVLESIN